MRSVVRTVIFAILAASLASATFAAKHPRSPSLTEPGLRIVTAAPPANRIAALATGGPGTVAECNAWVTSFYEYDDFTTNYYWCDFESLRLIVGFFTAKPKLIHATAVIKNSAGHTVKTLAADYVSDPAEPNYFSPGFINYVEWDLTPHPLPKLPAGWYKATVKIKQGDTVVGQSFWIQVTAGTDPDCELGCGGVYGDACSIGDDCCLGVCLNGICP